MTPDGVKAAYGAALGEWVLIRRYTGTGTTRPHFDVRARARIVGYAPNELVGGIQQGDRRAIVLADDLFGSGLTMPVLNTDKLVDHGRELQIIAVDADTRKIDGVLIAYELQVRG